MSYGMTSKLLQDVLPIDEPVNTFTIKDLERIKWYLWHGNVFQALNKLQSLEMDLDAAAFESRNENSPKLLKGVEELHT